MRPSTLLRHLKTLIHPRLPTTPFSTPQTKLQLPLLRHLLLRQFTTTPSAPTPAPPQRSGPPSSKHQREKKDLRVTLIRYHMQHPQNPRPLRLSRNRGLRHWTIHRAWLLFRRKRAEAQEMELQRMYKAMHDACEELRLLDGPDQEIGSRLYRIAMEKKGVFRAGGVPIEYARAQTETPGHEPWDHSWTR